MGNKKRNENEDVELNLSLDRAEEILKNVYQSVGIAPPDNCKEILRQGAGGKVVTK